MRAKQFMVPFELAYCLDNHVLFRQKRSSKANTPLFFPKTASWNDADARLLQQTQRIQRIRGLIIGGSCVQSFGVASSAGRHTWLPQTRCTQYRQCY